MNWYKQTQLNNVTINDIIRAIDIIICRDPDIITEEDMLNAFERHDAYYGDEEEQYALPKAAQTLMQAPPKKRRRINRETDPRVKYKDDLKDYVLRLSQQGWKNSEIARELEISSNAVQKILSELGFGKQEQIKYLKNRYMKEILRRVDEFKKNMINSKLNAKEIADELGIRYQLVVDILQDNNINLTELSLKRKFLIEDELCKIFDSFSTPPTAKQVIEEFYNKYYLKLTPNVAGRALAFRNRKIRNRSKKGEAFIFDAFAAFLPTQMQGTLQDVVNSPKYPEFVDRFIKRYGPEWGFSTPLDQENLRKMLMTKIQLRERTQQRVDMGTFYNRYVDSSDVRNRIINMLNKGISIPQVSEATGISIDNINRFLQLYNVRNAPIVYDESHPSYFLGKQ
jgi:AraC-like DNA-binding protein